MSEPLSEEEEAKVRALHVPDPEIKDVCAYSLDDWPCDTARALATLDQARERIAVLEDEASYLAEKVEAELGGEA